MSFSTTPHPQLANIFGKQFDTGNEEMSSAEGVNEVAGLQLRRRKFHSIIIKNCL